MAKIQVVTRRAAVALALFFGASLPATAMEFTPNRIDSTTVVIAATGRIMPGDSERLMTAFMPLPRDGFNILVLNSAGGNVVASEALAAAVRRVRARVVVMNGGVCASACFIVFAASPERYFATGARIGVHSASKDEYETMDSMAVTTSMARSAAEMGVPNGIIGRMVSTPPGDMAWLTNDELAAMGARRLPPSIGGRTPASTSSPPLPGVTTVPTTPIVTAAASQPAPTVKRGDGAAKDEQAASFQQGRADRSAWEQWFAALTGDTRLGAEYWTAQRSKQQPGNCVGTMEFQQACLTAKQRLALPDTRRKVDPQYWWGWNSL